MRNRRPLKRMPRKDGGDGYDRKYSCRRKQRYARRWKAEQAAFAACQRTGDLIDVYLCRYCYGWHIGRPGGHKDDPTIKPKEQHEDEAA